MHWTRHFQLQPFTAEALTEKVAISGRIVRQSGMIQVEYQVVGASACTLPSQNVRGPGRCHDLWRQTCFELFFGIQGKSAYWEVNFSPNGCWNMYHFTDYRNGMREELLVDQPCFDIIGDGDFFSLRCTIGCQSFIDDSVDLELAVSSVIQDTRGNTSYWAINHHGSKPDFHNRTSFSMVLPGIKTMPYEAGCHITHGSRS